VNARFRGLNRRVRVLRMRRANGYRVQAAFGEHSRHTIECLRSEASGDSFGPSELRVARGNELRLRQAR